MKKESTGRSGFFTTRNMAFIGLLIAIIAVMTFTPLGYLKAGPVEITFLPVPVAVGAIVLGPWAGALLGLVFGITSFIQCFMGSPLGTVLIAVQPVYCAIVCIIPRIIAGLLPAYIFRLLRKAEKSHRKIFSYAVSSLSCALINTVLFVGGLILFFGKTPELHELFDTSSVWSIIWLILGYNFIIEAVACCLLGGSIAKAVDTFVYKRRWDEKPETASVNDAVEKNGDSDKDTSDKDTSDKDASDKDADVSSNGKESSL